MFGRGRDVSRRRQVDEAREAHSVHYPAHVSGSYLNAG